MLWLCSGDFCAFGGPLGCEHTLGAADTVIASLNEGLSSCISYKVCEGTNV